MPTREEVLQENTFKDVPEVEKRVYYTLTANKELSYHRTAKLLAMVVARQVQRGELTPELLDDLLLEITR